jgi:hypothetical protein
MEMKSSGVMNGDDFTKISLEAFRAEFYFTLVTKGISCYTLRIKIVLGYVAKLFSDPFNFQATFFFLIGRCDHTL